MPYFKSKLFNYRKCLSKRKVISVDILKFSFDLGCILMVSKIVSFSAD